MAAPSSPETVQVSICRLNPLQKPTNVTTALLSSLFCTSIDAWNFLTSNLRHAPSTSAFEKAVEGVDFSRHFLEEHLSILYFILFRPQVFSISSIYD